MDYIVQIGLQFQELEGSTQFFCVAGLVICFIALIILIGCTIDAIKETRLAARKTHAEYVQAVNAENETKRIVQDGKTERARLAADAKVKAAQADANARKEAAEINAEATTRAAEIAAEAEREKARQKTRRAPFQARIAAVEALQSLGEELTSEDDDSPGPNTRQSQLLETIIATLKQLADGETPDPDALDETSQTA